MSKRCDTFERREKDDYPTPAIACAPLLKRLKRGTRFIEPCNDDDDTLIRHLESFGHVCVGRYNDGAETRRYPEATQLGVVAISNLPWRRDVMHPAIANLSDQMPLWGLIDADWLFTQQAAPYLLRLRTIAVIGRVKWIPGSKFSGKDSCCWCLFDRPRPDGQIHFIGRDNSRRRPSQGAGRLSDALIARARSAP
jgi:hypothetical protein